VNYDEGIARESFSFKIILRSSRKILFTNHISRKVNCDEEYENQRKLLKVRFCPGYIPTNRVNKNRRK
jgi:hypothetical protein